MRIWIAGILGAALAAGLAEAKTPPKDYAPNVTYCINRNLALRVGPQQESVGRLRESCEDLVASLDTQFRHEPVYVRGSLDQRQEILSDAIDCRVRFRGRPGTGFQDCVRDALDRFEPGH
jgi:hypothetical protein